MTVLKRDNLIRLQNNAYIVKTQAGFRKALKLFNCPDVLPSNKEGYPKKYPSLVFMENAYRGYFVLRSTCIPLSTVQEAINSTLVSSNTRKETTTNENIEGTVENWENRTLDADEAFVTRTPEGSEKEVDVSLDLVTIKLRMSQVDADKLQALAKQQGLTLQAYIKSVLAKELNKT